MVSGSHPVQGQVTPGATFEEVAAPGANYDTAAFRLWYPKDAGPLHAVVVLVPGSNGDGRSMVEDPTWRIFAVRHHVALLGCYFTDRPHALDFIEEYVNVSKGSGQALLNALSAFAGRAGHPELAQAPLLLWGMSAGGEFNYEFVAWKPERVVAFIVNKGGIYYTALMPPASREVPGILFVGGKDLESRTNTIVGLFSVNRRAGALWALAEEPDAEHVVGRSKAVATLFFEDVLALRLNNSSIKPGGAGTLNALTEKPGFLGDLKAKTFRAIDDNYPTVEVRDARMLNDPTAWLPTERVARAWRAVVTDTPFDPHER